MKQKLIQCAACLLAAALLTSGCKTDDKQAVQIQPANKLPTQVKPSPKRQYEVDLKKGEVELIAVRKGDRVILNVKSSPKNAKFHWSFRGTALEHSDSSLFLTNSAATIGRYRVEVFHKHSYEVYEADMQLVSGGGAKTNILTTTSGTVTNVTYDPITVTGAPTASSGGTLNGCPPRYKSSLTIGKPAPDFGFVPVSGLTARAYTPSGSPMAKAMEYSNWDTTCYDCQVVSSIIVPCTNAVRVTAYFGTIVGTARVILENFNP
jgi:hypothetical protein